jgi:hypothetical protein
MNRRDFLTETFSLSALLAAMPLLFARGQITVSPDVAKFVLQHNTSDKLFVMCRGYNEDDDNLTELVWEDDKDLDFHNEIDYPEFQLWWNPHGC